MISSDSVPVPRSVPPSPFDKGVPRPSPEAWPQYPVYVCLSQDSSSSYSSSSPCSSSSSSSSPSPSVSPTKKKGRTIRAHIPCNTLQRVPFESSLFVGEIVLNLAGLEPPPRKMAAGKEGRDGYFTGCLNRTLECAVQGRFKARVPFNEAYTGQAFQTPLHKLPRSFLVKAVQAVVRQLAPATQLDVTGNTPFILGPLATVSAVMAAYKEGEEKDILELGEDTTALGGPFSTNPKLAHDRAARRKFFSSPDHLASFAFEPGLVYGFGFFGATWRVSEWKLDVAGVRTLDLTHFVSSSQPLQIMALRREGGREGGQGGRGTCLWELDLYHARALASLEEGGREGGEGEDDEGDGAKAEGRGDLHEGVGNEEEDGEGEGEAVVEKGKERWITSLFRRGKEGGREGGRASTAPVG